METTEHHNNFNLLRLFFASLVVFSHAPALLGNEEYFAWGRSLGNLSVQGFFVISGYLICQSFFRSRGLLSYSWKRFLRIVPGLVVALLFTKGVATLCNGFDHNPVPHIANGPIWTLTWEAALYIGLAVIGVIGALQASVLAAFFASAWLLYVVNLHSMDEAYLVVAPFAMTFLTGAFLFVMADRIDIRKYALFGAVVLALTANIHVFQFITGTVRNSIPFVYGPSVSDEEVLRIAFLAAFPPIIIYLGRFAKPIGSIKHDISYGVYIYGWPVAQTMLFMAMKSGIALNPIEFFVATMLVTAPIAYASWRLIEQPFMSLKRFASRSKLPAVQPARADRH